MRSLKTMLAALLALSLLAGMAMGEDAVSSATLNVDALPVLAGEGDSNVLVVYFSTDDTVRAAAVIAADELGADLFEIVPEEPYTADDLNYSDSGSRATMEQRDDSARPAIAALPGDLSGYDAILLGYPIWWGKAPRILDTFVESVDLDGITIAPFCTSASSGAGSSARELQALAGEASEWLNVYRLDNGIDAEAIRAWARSLDIAEVSAMRMSIDGTPVRVEWEDNDAVAALRSLAKDGLTVEMHMYGGFEQVGPLGADLPASDVETTTQAGDIVLYSGDQIVVFYGSNTWSYTRLGHITDPDATGLAALLSNGDVTITIEAE